LIPMAFESSLEYGSLFKGCTAKQKYYQYQLELSNINTKCKLSTQNNLPSSWKKVTSILWRTSLEWCKA
jgi:hypothetical protein